MATGATAAAATTTPHHSELGSNPPPLPLSPGEGPAALQDLSGPARLAPARRVLSLSGTRHRAATPPADARAAPLAHSPTPPPADTPLRHSPSDDSGPGPARPAPARRVLPCRTGTRHRAAAPPAEPVAHQRGERTTDSPRREEPGCTEVSQGAEAVARVISSPPALYYARESASSTPVDPVPTARARPARPSHRQQGHASAAYQRFVQDLFRALNDPLFLRQGRPSPGPLAGTFSHRGDPTEGRLVVPRERAMMPLDEPFPGSLTAASSPMPASNGPLSRLLQPLSSPPDRSHQQAVWEASFCQWSASCRFLQVVWPRVIGSVLSHSRDTVLGSDRVRV